MLARTGSNLLQVFRYIIILYRLASCFYKSEVERKLLDIFGHIEVRFLQRWVYLV